MSCWGNATLMSEEVNTYVVDADASASLSIASEESAGGENLRSLHLS